ncbi:MAG TPA: preprotein translocase subunit YajC [Verrucomicrobiaceae bacterium]|jgi:preprotein translocase subunit YajC
MTFPTLMGQLSSLPAIFAQASPAPSAQPQPGGLFGNPMIFMVIMMVVMYFILIRPQRNKQKTQEEMQKAMAPGDEVVTIGGAHGVVTSVREKTVLVRVNEGKIEFDRSAIAQRVPKETPVTVEAAK